MDVIQTEGLTVWYKEQRGIEDLSFTVKEGEVLGFLGPNGAGKTTTVRTLLDIIHPERGRAILFGKDSVKEGAALRKRIGYLPGDLILPHRIRAEEYLNFIDSVYKKKSDRIYRKQLLKMLDLNPGGFIADYSRGNRQKIGIAAAFMIRPDLLILDEPTAGLDPLGCQRVRELILDAKREGRTVFLSSHNLREVEYLADRAALIGQGKLICTERVESLIEKQFKRIHILFKKLPPGESLNSRSVKEIKRENNRVSFTVQGEPGHFLKEALKWGIGDIETESPTLEEAFFQWFSRDKEEDPL